ncbi:hypothetical protein Tsp_15531, partial [Trichinella spiralis]|uniref:hypothetical protein n=1 Tax=Trichinella spiralis TaxID=6334 RepID=UPI0001EFEBD7
KPKQHAPVSSPPVMRGGHPKGGPPPERLINLSNVISPKLARRQADSPATLRLGSQRSSVKSGRWPGVRFKCKNKVPTSGREYGSVFVTIGKGKQVPVEEVEFGHLSIGKRQTVARIRAR